MSHPDPASAPEPNSGAAPLLPVAKKPLSFARRQALAEVQQRAREARAARVAALTVPTPFASADDFLSTLRRLTETMPPGVGRALAAHCGVDTGSVSKWLREKKRIIPAQATLDKLVAWWRAHRDKIAAEPIRRTAQDRAAQSLALTRLHADIADRLRQTARLRNVTAIQLAEQILDRHLPPAHELARG